MKAVIYGGARQFDHDLRAAVEKNGVDFLCYVNAQQRHIERLNEYRAFHMVRDPRDIAVSAYFSHLHSHPAAPWLAEHRATLRCLDKEAGLLLELESRDRQFGEMLAWNYENQKILEVRMEDVTSDPAPQMARIFEFLGILEDGASDTDAGALSRFDMERIAEKNSFAKKSGGRNVGEENVRSHFRKGMSGDWVNHFGPVHIEYFKANYNELLLKLGYEDRPDW